MITEAQLVSVLPNLNRYAHRLTRSAEDQKDLVQRAVTRIWSRRNQYQDEGGKLFSWCSTIMHHEYVNWRRLKATEVQEACVSIDYDGWSELFPAPDRADSRAVMRDLNRALAQLPKEQQQVIKLVVLDGLNYFQAADVVGIPVGTVRSRLARGREALRRIWNGE